MANDPQPPSTSRPRAAHTPITAVLFDFDDTLVSTYAARLDALQRVFSAAGITEPTAEAFIREMRGHQLDGKLRPIEEREGLPPLHLFRAYRHTYWTKTAGMISLFPGVRFLLEELHERGLKMGIVTQKGWVTEVEGRTVGASQELEETGVSHLFSVGVGLESVANFKPHPEGVLLALERLGARPEQGIVVGDTPADIGAAKAAGCWSVHATWGIPDGQPTATCDTDADFVIDTPEALLGLARLLELVRAQTSGLRQSVIAVLCHLWHNGFDMQAKTTQHTTRKPKKPSRTLARELGFDRVGVTSAVPFDQAEAVALERVRGGLMDGLPWYHEDRVRRGASPTDILPGARSIISLAMSYNVEDEEPPSGRPVLRGKVARYARGRDYHGVMQRRLKQLVASLSERIGRPVQARVYVDTGPMQDRAVAERAGIGWFGKNTNVLTSGLGSWVFLGQIVTDLAPGAGR